MAHGMIEGMVVGLLEMIHDRVDMRCGVLSLEP